MTRYALDELGLVEFQIATGNDASLRVADRREGVARSLYVEPGRRGDLVVYSRLPGG